MVCTEVEDAEDLKKALIEGGWAQIRYTRVLRRASPTRQSGSGKEESSARRCCNARLPTVIKRPVGVLFVQVRCASAMKDGQPWCSGWWLASRERGGTAQSGGEGDRPGSDGVGAESEATHRVARSRAGLSEEEPPAGLYCGRSLLVDSGVNRDAYRANVAGAKNALSLAWHHTS